MPHHWIIGVETSCDDSCVAFVNKDGEVLAHHKYSQLTEHQAYGGIVPQIAMRSHVEHLPLVFKKTWEEAHKKNENLLIKGVAVTQGPGLSGCLSSGMAFASGVAAALKLPIYGVHHLEGHALLARMTHREIAFPFLTLLISGGHTQFIWMKSVGDYEVLGETYDDALGECFDKTGRLMGFDYPAGAVMEKYARLGNENRFALSVPLHNDKTCHFSFSGLKTAMARLIQTCDLSKDIPDLCASFQKTVTATLTERLRNVIKLLISLDIDLGLQQIVISGGVASNSYIFQKFSAEAEIYGWKLIRPDPSLCTDNGVMIAWCAWERLLCEKLLCEKDFEYASDFITRPRWALSRDSFSVNRLN